jgi:hypothetical protein
VTPAKESLRGDRIYHHPRSGSLINPRQSAEPSTFPPNRTSAAG